MMSTSPASAAAARAVSYQALGIVARGHAAQVCSFIARAVIRIGNDEIAKRRSTDENKTIC
jgi:hypothetical protein